MKFKKWLCKEDMAGPGGGGSSDNTVPQEVMAKEIKRKGAGAFKDYSKSEEPPVSGKKSPDIAYYPQISPNRRYLKKK